MNLDNLKNKLEEAKKISKKRKFNQSIELIVVLKDVNLSEIKSSLQTILLPFYKDSKIVVFSEIKRSGIDPDVNNITLKDIETISQNKRQAKKIARSFDFSLAETKLIPIIGKLLGRFLAPLGKMPIPITDEKRLNEIIERLKKSIKLNLKQNQIQMKIGKENMKTEEIVENIKSALDQIISVLPNGERNIKKIYIKLSMGKPVKII